MSIVYRQELGRELTWSEADNNFAELKAGVDSKKSNFDVLPVTQGGTGQTTVDAVKVAFDIATKTELASSAAGKGAELVEYQGATVEAALNERLPEIGNYAGLDSYNGDATAVLVYGVANIFDGGAGVFRRTTDTPAAANGIYRQDALGRWWKRDYSGKINVKWFGAKGDFNGTTGTDDTAAFAAAVAEAKRLGGGRVFMPHAKYYLVGVAGADGVKNGVLLPFSGGADDGATSISIDLIGEDRDTALYAGSDNMIVVRCSTSHSEVGTFSVFSNGHSGVTAIGLQPQNLTTPDTYSQQSFNHVHDIYISRCADGLVLQCGGLGGCYYNEFRQIHIHGGSVGGRGVYFKNGVGTGSPSNSNRNQFYSVRVGYANIGFHIESGATNSFFGCSTEGILYGASPTAVRIENADANGRGNEINEFFGFMSEACTNDLICLNPRNSFFGCAFDASKSTLAADFVSSGAGTFVGSYDSTVFPNIYAGTMEYGSNLPAGIGSSYEFGSVATNAERFDLGGKYKVFALNTSNIGQIDSIASQVVSYWMKYAGMVDFTFRLAFSPVAPNSVITIPLPKAAHGTVYANFGTVRPFSFLVSVTNNTTTPIAARAEVNYENPAGTYLKILLPPGVVWDNSGGNTNEIHGTIRYRAA